MTPTHEQSAILNHFHSSPDNMMLIARAGTGKSATLKLLEQSTQSLPILYLVFGKDNQTKAEKEQKNDEWHSTTKIRTFNSLGHGVFGSAIAHRLILSKTKILDIYRQIIDGLSRAEQKEAWEVYNEVKKGVDMARNLGYIPMDHAKADKALCDLEDIAATLDERPTAFTLELIDQVLIECIRQSYQGIIDFNDQCYMAALFGGFYPKFPLVLIDEYQDLSPVQHAMIEKLCKNSRQIGVGDDAQAIYAFRGAKPGGMGNAIERFGMSTMPLSISFRCPSSIVANVRWRIPDFKAAKVGGSVHTARTGEQIADDSTIICRNNAPLISLAMALLYGGRSVNISGVDITEQLIRQMSKLGPEDMTQSQTIDAIANWEEVRLASESKTAKDMAGCMLVFASKAKTLGGAIAHIRHMLANRGTVQFMTGHKSKGLEFDRVYHLQSELCNRNVEQDRNLAYVVDTRSRNELIYI